MTDYTQNRAYPFPSSERETGNGGLHSELLARAVAADLDQIDADWAGEMQRSTLLLSLAADVTGLFNGNDNSLDLETVDKQTTGLGAYSSPGFDLVRVRPGGEGWYHVVASLRTRAEGAITANAQHRLILEVTETKLGAIVSRDKIWVTSFASGSTDVYNQMEAVFYLGKGDQLYMKYLHYNTASTCRAVATGTRLAVTKIVGV